MQEIWLRSSNNFFYNVYNLMNNGKDKLIPNIKKIKKEWPLATYL